MAVLVGIDEAGFGPILGPLVVSSSSFSLPHDLLTTNLWHVLKKSVSNSRKRLAGRILVADSKKAYTKSIGTKHLERTIAACLTCLCKNPLTAAQLLAFLCPQCLPRLKDYPWYQELENHRISTDSPDIAIASQVFANDMSSNQIELLGLASCCLDVAHYNKLVDRVKNKASVLFTATSQLIMAAWKNSVDEELQIIIDRQGGRIHYRKKLQLMFQGAELKVLKESPPHSSYELQANGKRMRLHFVVGGDNKFFPVSLASMASKYVRELLVSNINRYFTGFHPDLKPTAGYWKDGSRFIEDVKTNIPHLRIDHNQLVRSR